MNYHVISKDAVPTVNLVVGIILAVLIALILLGGIRRIGRVIRKAGTVYGINLYCFGSGSDLI